jgi:hypothetical protein
MPHWPGQQSSNHEPIPDVLVGNGNGVRETSGRITADSDNREIGGGATVAGICGSPAFRLITPATRVSAIPDPRNLLVFSNMQNQPQYIESAHPKR